MEKNEYLVVFDRKQLELFLSLFDLLHDATRWIKSLTADEKADRAELFKDLPDHYHVCHSVDILDVSYSENGIRFTNPHWRSCNASPIYVTIRPESCDDTYTCYKNYFRVGFRKYSIRPNINPCKGEIPEAITKEISDALKQFFNDLPKIYGLLSNNFNQMYKSCGRKEFGLEIDGTNYYQTAKPKNKETNNEKASKNSKKNK